MPPFGRGEQEQDCLDPEEHPEQDERGAEWGVGEPCPEMDGQDHTEDEEQHLLPDDTVKDVSD